MIHQSPLSSNYGSMCSRLPIETHPENTTVQLKLWVVYYSTVHFIQESQGKSATNFHNRIWFLCQRGMRDERSQLSFKIRRISQASPPQKTFNDLPDIFPLSCFLRCLSKLVCWPKHLSQKRHLNGFSLFWMLRTCRCRLEDMLKDLSQYLHLKSKHRANICKQIKRNFSRQANQISKIITHKTTPQQRLLATLPRFQFW